MLSVGLCGGRGLRRVAWLAQQQTCEHQIRNLSEFKEPAHFDVQQGLKPFLSPEAIQIHFKHQKVLHDTVNKHIQGTKLENLELEEIVKIAYSRNRKMFDEASDLFNHQFFWNSLAHWNDQGEITPLLAEQIKTDFGSQELMFHKIAEKAQFCWGAGWAWLCENEGSLQVEMTYEFGTPVVNHINTPLLCLDMWTHSYFPDYQNDKETYVQNWARNVNWDFASKRYLRAKELRESRTVKDSYGIPEEQFKEIPLEEGEERSPWGEMVRVERLGGEERRK